MKLHSTLFAVACALPLAVAAQNVAIVNGKPVPSARVDSLVQQATRSGQQQRTPELEQRARDMVVMYEIFTQEAESRGLAGTPEFQNQMEFARQQILARELFNDFEKNNPVTEDEAKAEYETHKAKAVGTEYRARHILVEKEADAKSLIAKIKGGAKFEDLAKKNSKDPGSAAKGGDLDWAGASSYVPEFSDAMKKLKKGEMTQTPVKSQFGYHIIKLEDTRDAQFPPFADVRPQIEQMLKQQKAQKFQEELRAKAKTDYKFATQ
jgi:peptidyl-prolyl cis-trans isomerase C